MNWNASGAILDASILPEYFRPTQWKAPRLASATLVAVILRDNSNKQIAGYRRGGEFREFKLPPQRSNGKASPFRSGRASPGIARQPVPTSQALSDAEARLLPELVKQRLEIPEPSSLRERAKKIFELAEQSEEDVVGQYFLANRALTMSANSADVNSTLAVLEWISAHYEIDDLAKRTELLTKLAGRNLDGDVLRKMNRELRDNFKQAVDNERFDLASRLLSSALALARKTSDWPTVREFEKNQIELQKMKRKKTAKAG